VVEVRAQGVGGEVLLPQARGQQVDLAGRVAVDALEDNPRRGRGTGQDLGVLDLDERSHGCLRWRRTQLVTQAPAHRLDAFQKQLQPRDVEFRGTRAPPVPDELAPLQALGPQTKTATVEVQGLEVIAE
jgi:hypothetical protein